METGAGFGYVAAVTVSELADIFEAPVIGPFVEPNGLSGPASFGEHAGATVTWSNRFGAWHWDLVRLPRRSKNGGYYGFASQPNTGLNDFLWDCFASSSRLAEFLNELTPYIRMPWKTAVSKHADDWLNPKLVAHGFTLGPIKAKATHVRTPLLWLFKREESDYRYRRDYSRVDFVDWTPGEVRLVDRPGDHWGLGSGALRRLVNQLIAANCGPLLTAAGEAKMRDLHKLALARLKPLKPPVRLSASDVALATDLRTLLRRLSHPLPPDVADQVDKLSEKAYAGVLRTCISQGQENAACALLAHRRMPGYGRPRLLERFVRSKWRQIWKACPTELQTAFNATSYGYNELIALAVEMKDPDLIKAMLGSVSSIDEGTAIGAVGLATDSNSPELVLAILNVPSIAPIRERCMLECFVESLSSYPQREHFAHWLLELGVRPIKALSEDEFDLAGGLLAHLPILKRAANAEPLTPESVATLLSRLGAGFAPRESMEWLCEVSRAMLGHNERMSDLVLRATVFFIRRGEELDTAILDRALSEGGTLATIPWSQIQSCRLLQGAGWEQERDRMLDLIRFLQKTNRQREIEILKAIKPKPPRSAQSKSAQVSK